MTLPPQTAIQLSQGSSIPHLTIERVMDLAAGAEKPPITESRDPVLMLQEQLGHATAKMTLRYLKTLSASEALMINKQVDL